MTETERRKLAREVQRQGRGRVLGKGEWRNYCAKCDAPITVHAEWLRLKDDLVCDECRPPIPTDGALATAFSPEKGKHW